jgi:hypothetical protein
MGRRRQVTENPVSRELRRAGQLLIEVVTSGLAQCTQNCGKRFIPLAGREMLQVSGGKWQ